MGVLPYMPRLEVKPTTYECALTENGTGNLLVFGTTFPPTEPPGQANMLNFHVYKTFWPWLVWLSGLSAGLRPERLPVQFPVRANAGLWARSPVGGV